MTAPVITHPTQAGSDAIATGHPPKAVSARRWFIVASPVLAGLFAIVGAAADPAAGQAGREMWEVYTANPEPLQFKSLGFHWSYAFWIGPALLLAAYVKGKGAWLANIAALVGFAGMTTLPGLLFVDWYDSAIGQMYGVDAIERVNDHMNATMWGIPVFILPGIIGLALALPLAAAALWRAGLVRWWAPVAVVAAFAVFLLSGVMWWGCLLSTVFLTVFAVAVERATRPVQGARH